MLTVFRSLGMGFLQKRCAQSWNNWTVSGSIPPWCCSVISC